ncbi:unnamed protein product [Bursaphelenchus xylophilus]|uniref:(pine wood nematode) hypothetical protein n=1 Tax=Bursaphelenchus xylophilus TaxID=6326 RepID=A0A1I7S163_BURXY|nr:unnamed protein product [Bursaphelenchus xylophilus]CAG9080028.1 unnamed protein product [Bursaphelenchus xylophilus]
MVRWVLPIPLLLLATLHGTGAAQGNHTPVDPSQECIPADKHPHRIGNHECTEFSFQLLISKADMNKTGIQFNIYSRQVLIDRNLTMEVWLGSCLAFEVRRERTDATRYKVVHPSIHSSDFLFDDQRLHINIQPTVISMKAPRLRVIHEMRLDCPLPLHFAGVYNDQTYYRVHMGLRFSATRTPEMNVNFPDSIHIGHPPEAQKDYYKPREHESTKVNEKSWVLPVIFVAGGLLVMLCCGLGIGLYCKFGTRWTIQRKSKDAGKSESNPSSKASKSSKESAKESSEKSIK